MAIRMFEYDQVVTRVSFMEHGIVETQFAQQ